MTDLVKVFEKTKTEIEVINALDHSDSCNSSYGRIIIAAFDIWVLGTYRSSHNPLPLAGYTMVTRRP